MLMHCHLPLAHDFLGSFSIENLYLFHSIISEYDKTPTHVFICLPIHNNRVPSQMYFHASVAAQHISFDAYMGIAIHG